MSTTLFRWMLYLAQSIGFPERLGTQNKVSLFLITLPMALFIYRTFLEVFTFPSLTESMHFSLLCMTQHHLGGFLPIQ